MQFPGGASDIKVGLALTSPFLDMTIHQQYTDEWGDWFRSLSEGAQDAIAAVVGPLEGKIPQLPFPYSSGVKLSRHGHMRELRVQVGGHPLRILYAFDPRRVAILLIGGDKTGEDRWYERFVPIADGLYDDHLRTIADEGLI